MDLAEEQARKFLEVFNTCCSENEHIQRAFKCFLGLHGAVCSCKHMHPCEKYNGQWKFSLLLGSYITEGNSTIFKLIDIPVLQVGREAVWPVCICLMEAAAGWELLMAPLPLGIAQPSWWWKPLPVLPFHLTHHRAPAHLGDLHWCKRIV